MLDVSFFFFKLSKKVLNLIYKVEGVNLFSRFQMPLMSAIRNSCSRCYRLLCV